MIKTDGARMAGRVRRLSDMVASNQVSRACFVLFVVLFSQVNQRIELRWNPSHKVFVLNGHGP